MATKSSIGSPIFATAVLMLVIMALNDPNNMAPSKGYVPLLVGLLVVTIGMTFSHNCGYPINPARDLAPRVFTFAAGWGIQVFSHNNYGYFWIPIAGPHIGAVLGGFIYEVCINTTLPCSSVRSSSPRPENPTIQATELQNMATTKELSQHSFERNGSDFGNRSAQPPPSVRAE